MTKHPNQVEIVSDNILIEDLIKYTESPYFMKEIEIFINNHKEQFIDEQPMIEYSEYKRDRMIINDIPIKYTLIFENYQKLIESLFNELAITNNVTLDEIYTCFRDSGNIDGKFTLLFQENEYKWFVDKVLSWLDFDEFLKLMYRSVNTTYNTTSSYQNHASTYNSMESKKCDSSYK